MKLRILSFQALALGATLLFLACPPGNISTNQAPVVNAGTDTTATVGTAKNLTATATDADGDSLTYTWVFDPLPAGSFASLIDSDTLTVSFTPDVAGEYVLRFTADDGQAEGSDTVTVTASNPTPGNTPPVIVTNSMRANQRTYYTTGYNSWFDVKITDANGDSLTASAVLTSIPENLLHPMDSNDIHLEKTSSNIWYLYYDDYVSAGIYTITITASDGTDTVTKEIPLEIVEVEVQPSLFVNAISGPSGTTFSLTGRAQDDCELYENYCSFIIARAPSASSAALSAVTQSATASSGYINDRYCTFTPVEIGKYVIQYQVKEGNTLRSASITLSVFDSANGGVDVSFK